MYYVYLLVSQVDSNQIYIGHTNNLSARLAQHNDGKSNHTSKFKPWKIKMYLAFDAEAKAVAFEQYLKTGSGKTFVKRRLL
jgi:predicted GIY-YIG superfamily endonuclease